MCSRETGGWREGEREGRGRGERERGRGGEGEGEMGRGEGGIARLECARKCAARRRVMGRGVEESGGGDGEVRGRGKGGS